MAYELRIQRDATAITLDDWRHAVAAEPYLRLATEDLHIRNPQTGEWITFPVQPGDTDLFDPVHATWKRIFFWHTRGYVFFRAADDWANPSDPIRRMSHQLAYRLRAQVIGEENEMYTPVE